MVKQMMREHYNWATGDSYSGEGISIRVDLDKALTVKFKKFTIQKSVTKSVRIRPAVIRPPFEFFRL